FMKRLPSETRGRITDITAGALQMLQDYDWPGNIRQLENAVFRACVLCEGDVLTEEEFPQIRTQVEGVVRLDAGDVVATAPADCDEPDQALACREFQETVAPAPAGQLHFG